MIAPLCALILIGVALLRDGFLKDLVEGPAVVLATSTAVGPASGAAPDASPSALISDAVSPPVTPVPQTGAEAYPIDAVPTNAPPPAATATNGGSQPEAPTAVVPTQPVQPTITPAVNATAIPATPTPLGAATATLPAATPTVDSVIAPTETPRPDGWWFRGIKSVPVLVNDETQITLMAEVTNNSMQRQGITALTAVITLSDGSTRKVEGDDLYWPIRDVDFSAGLPSQGRMPIEISIPDVSDGVSVSGVVWDVKSVPDGDIGRTDLQLTKVSVNTSGRTSCLQYQLLVPAPEITSSIVIGAWVKNLAGEVIGVGYDYNNGFKILAGFPLRDSLCVTLLDGEKVETSELAVWGQ